MLVKRAEKVVERKIKEVYLCNKLAWDPEAFVFVVRKQSRIEIQISDIVFPSPACIW